MVFNSLSFLIFFAVVLLFHNLVPSWKVRKKGLLFFSYLFYAAWNPPFVILLWISTAVDWVAGKKIINAKTRFQKKVFLTLSLVANLGLLGFFKYGNFLLDNFIYLLGLINIDYHPARPDIILPVGISFYTFQSMSYSLDIYRGKMKQWRSFWDFALYVTFFPQLVAGPIVRAIDFLPQLIEPVKVSARRLGWGLSLLVIGLYEKVFLADAIFAPVVDSVYGNTAKAGFADAWLGTLAFSGQIFFDFAGYSTCAIGTALCLGFILPDNFKYPYGAIGFADFWRRWHISLSTWLRDYLYIPLGGNRKGPTKAYVNLMLTMLIGGLWHGASWRYVIWGGLHGAFLMADRLIRKRFKPVDLGTHKLFAFFLATLTYFFLQFTWVVFRSQDFTSVFNLLQQMFQFNPSTVLTTEEIIVIGTISVVVFLYHYWMRDHSIEDLVLRMPAAARVFFLAVMLITLALIPGDDRAFIYFQF
jgi:alginate O-acetyltransferase complex protein AlgI